MKLPRRPARPGALCAATVVPSTVTVTRPPADRGRTARGPVGLGPAARGPVDRGPVDRGPAARWVACLLGVLVVLSGCRLDMQLDVNIAPDGTGSVVLAIEVDADVVARVPTIADELVLDDIRAAGWTIEGPAATEAGGLRMVLSRPFESDSEATNLLRSIGGPFKDMEVQRTTSGDEVTTQVRGRIGVTDGFATFADDELIAVIGGFPFADEINASGATPESSIGIVVRADIPGEPLAEATNNTRTDGDVLVWDAPTDGTVLEWLGAARQAPAEGAPWARPVAIAALVALIAWLVFMTGLIITVIISRWRRARAQRAAPHGPPPVY